MLVIYRGVTGVQCYPRTFYVNRGRSGRKNFSKTDTHIRADIIWKSGIALVYLTVLERTGEAVTTLVKCNRRNKVKRSGRYSSASKTIVRQSFNNFDRSDANAYFFRKVTCLRVHEDCPKFPRKGNFAPSLHNIQLGGTCYLPNVF